MLTPAFHFNALKQFVNIQIEEGNHVTQCLKKNKQFIINDLFLFISHHTLNIICGKLLKLISIHFIK